MSLGYAPPSLARPRRAVTIAAAIAALALAVPASALATGNLVQNPGAEDGGSGPAVPIPGWQSSGGFSVRSYGVAPGPSAASGERIDGGRSYFWGGPLEGDSTATQTVSLAAYAGRIDVGQLPLLVGAFLGREQGTRNTMALSAQALNGAGAVIGAVHLQVGSASSPAATSSDLAPLAASAPLPAGTRALRLVLAADHLDGSGDEAYADNLVATVGDPSPATISSAAPALAARLLEAAPPGTAASVLAQLSPQVALGLLESLSSSEKPILDALARASPRRALTILGSSPATGARLLAALPVAEGLRVVRSLPARDRVVARLLDHRVTGGLAARLLGRARPSASARLLARLTPRLALAALERAPRSAGRVLRELAWIAPRDAGAVLSSGHGPHLFAHLPLDYGMHVLLALPSSSGAVGRLLGGLSGGASYSYRLRLQIIRIARSQLGVGENPPGTKCNPYGPCEEWCADFATWVWGHAGVSIGRIAWVPDLETWGQQHGTWKSGDTNSPEPGDMIIFTWQHVGLVEQVSPSGQITEISGNSLPGYKVNRSGPAAPSNWSALGPSSITGYVSPPGANAVEASSAKSLPVPTKAEIAAQDGGTQTQAERAEAARDPALQHLPFSSPSVQVEIGDRLANGRIALEVSYSGTLGEARRTLSELLARYHDRATGYSVSYVAVAR